MTRMPRSCMSALFLTIYLTGSDTSSVAKTPEERVLSYAKHDEGLNTQCYNISYGHSTKGVCWDLAACAISTSLARGSMPWNCRGTGLCGAAGADDYKKRPECYVWGQEVAPPTGNWSNIWNEENTSFVDQGVKPGDVLQLDNYTANCGESVWEGTDGGPHTAIITKVHKKSLTVCHQHWKGNYNAVCGYTFFHWFKKCDRHWTYSYDTLKVYRPGPSSTGDNNTQCSKCRIFDEAWMYHNNSLV